MFDCTQNKGIFCRCKIYTNGQISIVIYNQTDVPQHITSKMKLICGKADIDWIVDVNGVRRALRNDTKRIQMVTSSVEKHDTLSLVQRLKEMFPNVFCDKVRSANGNLLRIRVSERDLLWNYEPKPCWRENYFSDLTEKEITEEIESLLEEEIIRVLSTDEAIHAVVAPLNFLRKPNGKIRPTIDFRDSNTYLKGRESGWHNNPGS